MMQSKWVRLTKASVNLGRIVAVEDGTFDEVAGDFRAIVTFDAGARLELEDKVTWVLELLELAAAERTPPPPLVPPARPAVPANHEHVLTLCRQLIALNEVPEPGIAAWHRACSRVASELYAELSKDVAGYDAGTPIAGAGCV